MTEQLLAMLRNRASRRGRVMASEETLRDQLKIGSKDLADELRKLEHAKLIEVLAPLPFLIAKLPGKWPGEARNAARTASSRYSHSFNQSKRLNESYSHGPDKLLAEILETLGESDPASFRGAVRNFSPELIRATLTRVRAMKITKNRTAAFRYLLPRIARARASATKS
jgi:hypothetical protein